jgi:drug/metabolite transporter (DMT)-like permease
MNTSRANKEIVKAEAYLLLTAAIWGLAFVAQRKGMEFIGPFAFNGIRFALGSISLVPIIIYFRKKDKAGNAQKKETPAFKNGIWLGLILFVAASLQQVGMVYTTSGNAGFITSMYVILVPIIGIFIGHKIPRQLWVGAILAFAGLYFLSVRGTLSIQLGDGLVLLSALFWAIHVLAISFFAPKNNVLALSAIQFAVCSILSLLVAFVFESFTLNEIYQASIPILYGGIMSVGVAYTIQVYAQKTAPPSHAAVILSLESLFAALGGWLILSEQMDAIKIFGCVLMLAGVIISQIKFAKD